MGNKSVRISTTAGGSDKYLKLKLEQDVNMIEILSIKISQKDIYTSFNSDYGVLVGRVIANGGIGIPNAKLSIFIPISDEDKNISEILSIYPYTTPRDKNVDGVRYNLLPRVAVNNPFLAAGAYAPSVPIGTFPTKEEITTNSTYLEVYKKYYKYTTITNNSGDYMFYGIPVGVQTVHMSVDITDIGKYSMTPITMINQLGYSSNLFDQNGTKIKFDTDLDTLPNVEIQEVAVDIRPFWGDSNNFEIGITRQDFKIRAKLLTSFIVFGSSFTNSPHETRYNKDSATGYKALHKAGDVGYSVQDISIGTKVEGNINVNIMSLKNSVDESKVGTVSSLNIYSGGTFNTETDYEIIDSSQYNLITDKGNFVLIIPCNRKKVITNEFGQEVETTLDNPNGIFVEFRGFITFEMTKDSNVPTTGSYGSQKIKFKIPQNAPLLPYKISNPPNPPTSFSQESTGINQNSEDWRKQHYKFESNKIYTVSKFHGLAYSNNNSFFQFDDSVIQYNLVTGNFDTFQNVGILFTDDTIGITGNTIQQFPYNNTYNGTSNFFGAEWLNMSLWFDVYGYANGDQGFPKVNSSLTYDFDKFYYVSDPNNKQLIGGKLKGTLFYQRGDLHKTTFTEMPVSDINAMYNAINDSINPLPKGFYSNTPPFNISQLNGNYPTTSGTQYFYRGIGQSDSISFLKSLGFV